MGELVFRVGFLVFCSGGEVLDSNVILDQYDWSFTALGLLIIKFFGSSVRSFEIISQQTVDR